MLKDKFNGLPQKEHQSIDEQRRIKVSTNIHDVKKEYFWTPRTLHLQEVF